MIATVPTIGPKLARRIHEQLGIETLEDLEAAAHYGRLSRVKGMGRKRLSAIKDSLAGRFRLRSQSARPTRASSSYDAEEPSVAELLDVDTEYRNQARSGHLPKIAPRRFNPTGEAWLPVLHTVRHSRHYTAMFSNSARAHELGTFRDWVVLYRDDRDGDGQWTVITAHFGPLLGKRIVRGREEECAKFYQSHGAGETQLELFRDQSQVDHPASRGSAY